MIKRQAVLVCMMLEINLRRNLSSVTERSMTGLKEEDKDLF